MIPGFMPVIPRAGTYSLYLAGTAYTDIQDGDAVLLAQISGSSTIPALPSGYTSLYTWAYFENPDEGPNIDYSGRLSYAQGTTALASVVPAGTYCMRVIRCRTGRPLIMTQVSTGSVSLAGYKDPVGFAQLASAEGSAGVPSSGTVDGVTDSTTETSVSIFTINTGSTAARICSWYGNEEASSVTLANGSGTSAARWLVISRE